MRFVATFYTHAAALLTNRRLQRQGIESRLGPVPRKLSSSCGTCVQYMADDAKLELMDTDVESVYEVTENGYEKRFHHE